MKENKYSFRLQYSTNDNGFIATCPEFPGLSAFGETSDEALKEAKIALQLFVEDAIESNTKLPDPIEVKNFSGQIRLRLPKSLHRKLSESAELEGVSLNTLLVELLSSGLIQNQIERDKSREANFRFNNTVSFKSSGTIEIIQPSIMTWSGKPAKIESTRPRLHVSDEGTLVST